MRMMLGVAALIVVGATCGDNGVCVPPPCPAPPAFDLTVATAAGTVVPGLVISVSLPSGETSSCSYVSPVDLRYCSVSAGLPVRAPNHSSDVVRDGRPLLVRHSQNSTLQLHPGARVADRPGRTICDSFSSEIRAGELSDVPAFLVAFRRMVVPSRSRSRHLTERFASD